MSASPSPIVPVHETFSRGTLAFRPATSPVFAFQGLSGSVGIDGRNRSLREAVPIATPSPEETAGFRFADSVEWHWRLRRQDDFLYLQATLQNHSGKDIILEDWNVLEAAPDGDGSLALGEVPEQVRFFRWLPWNMRVERLAAADAPCESNTLCHLYDPQSGLTVLLGFVTLDRMPSGHTLHYRREAGDAGYRAHCACGGHRLAHGDALRSETLRIGYHRDPRAALESWAEEVHQAYRPSFKGVSGVCMGGANLEDWPEAMEARAKSAAEILRGFGIALLTGGTHQILKHGLPGNWLTFESFDGDPNACETRLQTLQDQGFCFKFWFSPFWFFAEAEGGLEPHREYLLKDADGNPVTQRFEQGGWEFARGPWSEKPLTKVYLDATHPGARSFLRRIFTAYRALGGRAYMLDFLRMPTGARPHDDRLFPLELGRKILSIIRDAAGEDTHLQTAVASSPGFIGCIQAARVVRDYGEERPLHPTPNWRNAEYCLHDQHFSNAHSFVQNAAASWFTHRKLYINDLNQIKIDLPVPLEMARLSATMFGLSGDSPMVIGDDLRRMAPDRLRLLKMCLPRTTGVPVPVDLFERVAPEDFCHVLKKPIVTDWDDYTLVAVFNTSPDHHAPVTDAFRTRIDFDALGLPVNESYRVFDVWNQVYLGTYRDSFEGCVPPDACRLYRVAAARPHPWLLGSDMHIEQGRGEIESLAWNDETRTLKGLARRPVGEHGNLFFLMPRHLKLRKDTGTNKMKEVLDMQTVVRLPIDFRTERQEFELRFEPLDTPYLARKGWLPYATEEEWRRYLAEHPFPDPHRVIE